MNIVIMAGGGGTRLWPVSREQFPKQFTQLFDRKTLLQHTFGHALAVVRDPRQIVVTTRDVYAREIVRQLPRLPRKNILVEPTKRDTAPSIGLAAAFFAARGDHDEPMVMMPSDPYVRNERLYRSAVRLAGELLTDNAGVTVLLGNTPTYPETGYGYIEVGARLGRHRDITAHAVRRFREKPDLPQAKRFLSSGKFVWNMGVYGWRVSTLIHLLHQFAPTIARRVDTLTRLFATRASAARVARVYRTMPSVSIDYAVTERQDPTMIRVLSAAYGWSDVGHWGALEELLRGRAGLELKRGVVLPIHCRNNFVYNAADVAVGLVGVENLIVVSTPDGILVCDKGHVQDVKKLVEELKKSGYTKFL